MLRRYGPLLAVVGTALVATGCSSSGSHQASAPPQPAPTVTTPACPTPPKSKPTQWPAKVPSGLPKPPNVRILDQQTTTDGVYVLKFRTPTSLRQSVIFVVEKLPKAGFVLGRGDAEAAEADAPFLHGTTRGLIRMLETGPCQTDWLLAAADQQSSTGGSPLLTPHSPTGSPSPLPFG